MKNKVIIRLSAILLLITISIGYGACSGRGQHSKGVAANEPPTAETVKLKPPTAKKPQDNAPTQPAKPTVNVYIENSGSMFGYVKGVTEFETSVYSFLNDINISQVADDMNLHYINSKILKQPKDIEEFIKKLEPNTFKIKGGNLATSDLANVLRDVLSKTQDNSISILVTDGIFSPGNGHDASDYLVQQQIGIKKRMSDYLQAHPDAAVIVYQLSSNFNGTYYNKTDAKSQINEQRPFYIWAIGKMQNLKRLRKAVPDSKFQGSGVTHVFMVFAGNQTLNYAVKLNSGDFNLDKTNPKTTIVNLRKDSHTNTVRFSVKVNFSKLLLDDAYLCDPKNYDCGSHYRLASVKPSKDGIYTHVLNFTATTVHKGQLTIKLKTRMPSWVEDVNDDDGSKAVPEKTYGIKYQLNGIFEAYTFNNDNYAELKINIK